MTAPLSPITPVLPVAAPAGQTQAAAGAQAAVPAAALPAAGQVQPTPPAAPVTSSVQWSAQTLQNLKLQAFEHLIAQLALQIQGSPGAPAATWPTQGLPAATQQFLQNLLAQIQVTVQGQTQPLQLLAGQQGSVALMQALVQAASAQPGSTSPHFISPSSALQTAAALSPTAAAALEQAGRSPAVAATAPRLPLLQNWLVQQGTLVTPQGDRGFSLTLQVPAAWAQTVGGQCLLPRFHLLPALRKAWLPCACRWLSCLRSPASRWRWSCSRKGLRQARPQGLLPVRCFGWSCNLSAPPQRNRPRRSWPAYRWPCLPLRWRKRCSNCCKTSQTPG